jgi:UDP:flavonoid glycosyltransferase YjiC (YdhE family)
MNYEERFQKIKTGLKVAIVSWAEMGHFMPCAHLGEEIVSWGHEVIFIVNNYGKERCSKMVEAFGAKCIATNDSLCEQDLAPKAKNDFGWI